MILEKSVHRLLLTLGIHPDTDDSWRTPFWSPQQYQRAGALLENAGRKTT